MSEGEGEGVARESDGLYKLDDDDDDFQLEQT